VNFDNSVQVQYELLRAVTDEMVRCVDRQKRNKLKRWVLFSMSLTK